MRLDPRAGKFPGCLALGDFDEGPVNCGVYAPSKETGYCDGRGPEIFVSTRLAAL